MKFFAKLFKSKAKPSDTAKEIIKNNNDKKFVIRYNEPSYPVPDYYFANALNDVICIQYWSCNDFSGSIHMGELILSERPDLKDKVLLFLEEHPIITLLESNRHEYAHDRNRWKFRFIFNNTNFNRCICGYGITEISAPYLLELAHLLPEILSEEECAQRDFRKKLFLAQIEQMNQDK